jgi:acetyl-CoA C-acetyltransferase
MELKDIVAISAARTPMGRFGGTLKDLPVYKLGALAIKEVLSRAGVAGEDVDNVNLGHCRQAGNYVNPAHSAAAMAGIPYSVPSISLNMACPAGMRAITMGCQEILTRDCEIVVAGGMDSMSTIPWLLRGTRFAPFKMGPKTLEDGWSDSLDPVHDFLGMGDTAENIAEKYGIRREEMDAFALESHRKAKAAQDQGLFEEETFPVEVPQRKGDPVVFAKDESIRADTTLEKLAKLPAVFRKGGKVTAGNACGMTDGACAVVLTTRERAKSMGAEPLFSILGYSMLAVDGRTMGEGPALSVPLALKRAGMSLDDMDSIEINEAFAAQVLANIKELELNPEKLNRNGGAIALGHPTGISGARIVITLYNVLRQTDGEMGVAGICGGGGVSMAMVIRREK